MNKANLHFFGATGCVTGSCMLLETRAARLLIECGMFQGTKTLKELNYRPFPFDPASIDAVLLTHAHIDHSGLLPKLAVAGCASPIFATAGTRDLCAVLLPDAGAIQEIEVEQLNRRNRRRARDTHHPIYTAADGRAVMQQFRTVQLRDWVAVAPGVRARWRNAGHILGSTSIEVEVCDDASSRPLQLLFSGDLGPGRSDLADDPSGPAGVDHVVVESTYGGAERAPPNPATRRAQLATMLQQAHARGGPLLIPAFAVERTQELIVDLIDVMEKTEAPPGPIFLDSPLAIKACDVFLRRGHIGSGDNPFSALRESRLLQFSESAAESHELARQKGWHIIIAASGMCDAGRVRRHLRRLLPREDATVLITGYQAVGTLGRLLVDGRREVRIQGDEIAVRACIEEIDTYSGHADAAGLLNWVTERRPVAGSVFITHGEPENAEGLKARLMKAGFAADRLVIPGLDQVFELSPGVQANLRDGPQPRIAPDKLSHLDWHNARVDFLTALEHALKTASSDADREALLAGLTASVAGKASSSAPS